MNGPFDKGIDAQELGIFLAITDEMAQEAEEERQRLLEEQEQDEPDDLDEEDTELLPGL